MQRLRFETFLNNLDEEKKERENFLTKCLHAFPQKVFTNMLSARFVRNQRRIRRFYHRPIKQVQNMSFLEHVYKVIVGEFK